MAQRQKKLLLQSEVAVRDCFTPFSRPVAVKEKKLPSSTNVRFLFHPGELEGGEKGSNMVFERLQH